MNRIVIVFVVLILIGCKSNKFDNVSEEKNKFTEKLLLIYKLDPEKRELGYYVEKNNFSLIFFDNTSNNENDSVYKEEYSIAGRVFPNATKLEIIYNNRIIQSYEYQSHSSPHSFKVFLSVKEKTRADGNNYYIFRSYEGKDFFERKFKLYSVSSEVKTVKNKEVEWFRYEIKKEKNNTVYYITMYNDMKDPDAMDESLMHYDFNHYIVELNSCDIDMAIQKDTSKNNISEMPLLFSVLKKNSSEKISEITLMPGQMAANMFTGNVMLTEFTNDDFLLESPRHESPSDIYYYNSNIKKIVYLYDFLKDNFNDNFHPFYTVSLNNNELIITEVKSPWDEEGVKYKKYIFSREDLKLLQTVFLEDS